MSASTICHSFQCFICTLIYYCHIKYQLSLLRSTVGINVSSAPHEVSTNLILFLYQMIWKANLRFLSSCLPAAKDRQLAECIKGDFWETKTRIREEGRKAAAGHITRLIVPHVSVNSALICFKVTTEVTRQKLLYCIGKSFAFDKK